jgi:anthranilate synthase component 1
VTPLPADFEAFAETYGRREPQVLWRRLIDDLETPISAYMKVGLGKPYAFLLESMSDGGLHRGRYSIVTLEPDLVWRCHGDHAEIAEGEEAVKTGTFAPQPGGALASLRALVEATKMPLPAELPPMAAGLFGAIGYDMIRLVEPIGPAKADTLSMPDAVMTRPSIVAVFDSISQDILLITPVRPGPLSAGDAYQAAQARLDRMEAALRSPVQRTPPAEPHEQAPPTSPVCREDYHQIVAKAREYIAAGDIFQVVPSHRFRAPFELSPFAFYRSLRRLNPSPYLFFMDFGDFQLAGSSPEILVTLKDGKVTIRPIAGTRPRGATPEEDLALEQELLADPKERSEHLMLLDLGRNDVGRAVMLNDEGRNAPLSTKPRVRVTYSFQVHRYSTVMHIVSDVEGDAPEGLDPVDVILTALPAGTLSGAPKVRAMQIIDELEREKRGMAYAGCAGYISSTGQVDTCIVLRTALFKDGMMYVQGGGGVVADSDPDAEYDETLHKTRALHRAAKEAWRFA